MIISWDEPRKDMVYLIFNVVTGELGERFKREQFKTMR